MNDTNPPPRTPLSIIYLACSEWLRRGPGRLLVASVLISTILAVAGTLAIQGLLARSNNSAIPLLGPQVVMSDDTAVASVTQKSAPAVVSIFTQGAAAPTASGFLIGSNGYIVTSPSAVVNTPRIQVELAGDVHLHDARVVDQDCQTGLVVLKVDQVNQPSTLSLGDSSAVQPGQTGILLEGTPPERSSVYRTLVNGVGRMATVTDLLPDSGDVQMSGLIEAQLPADGKFNGAPLLNIDGQVIGLYLQANQQGTPIQLIEPANALQGEVQQATSGQPFSVPDAGLDSIEVSPEQVAAAGVAGARITAVDPSGPAAASGLKVDDVITRLNDTSIDLTHPLPLLLRTSFHPGQRISITYQRAGQTAQVQLTLQGKHPECHKPPSS